MEEVSEIFRILDLYSQISGQKVNRMKSRVIFGKKMTQETKDEVKSLTTITHEGGAGKYLGLPESLGRSKVAALNYIEQRIRVKLGGWENQFLTQSGKEVLMKAVIQAIPTFTMSCFKLPKTTCKKITGLISRFRWKTKKESQGIHWKEWGQLCNTKKEGGLGFKDLEAFNVALLGKQIWRLLKEPNSLVARVIKQKYHKTTNLLNAKSGTRPSYFWRSVLLAIPLMRSGVRKSIGSGEDTKCWEDSWLPTYPPRPPRKRRGPSAQIELVQQLILPTVRQWNQELLLQCCEEEDIPWIQQVIPGLASTKDTYVWEHTKNGEYSVRSGSWFYYNNRLSNGLEYNNNPNLEPLYKAVWKANTIPKIRAFLWRVMRNCLATGTNLQKKQLVKENSCAMCNEAEESVNHLLFTCPFARLTWAISGIPGVQSSPFSGSVYTNMARLLIPPKPGEEEKKLLDKAPWILWWLWKHRNEVMFKSVQPSAELIVKKAEEELEE